MSMLHIDDREVSAAGKTYGYWWYNDDFDTAVDGVLKARAKRVPDERIAIDIGCAVGERALHLASLGIFQEVVACDIENRTDSIAAHTRQKSRLLNSGRQIEDFHAASCETLAPVRFLQASITELRPWHFEGSRIGFINCRNVGHFLTPPEFRQGLENIADIATPGTFVALSFDSYHGTRGPRLSLHENISRETLIQLNHLYQQKNIHNYSFDPERNGARCIYDEQEVRAYMRKLGFVMLKVPQPAKTSDDWWEGGSSNLRDVEARIFAVRVAKPANAKLAF